MASSAESRALIIVLVSLEMAIAVGRRGLPGLGVQAATPSWGAMIAEGRGYLMVSWWAWSPDAALIVAVVSSSARPARAPRPSPQDRRVSCDT
jgi:peptide/nickel transport system permease protein